MKRPRQATLTLARQPQRKRRTFRRYGLVPSYRGFQPRAFSRGEWKYSDVTISTAVNSDVPTMTLLNGLVPGTGASQRIGMKVSIRSIEMRLVANADLVGALAQTNRFILVRDGQANGAAPAALTDIITPGNVRGLRALVNRKRFRIMLDKMYELTPVAGDYARKCWKIYMKLRRPIVVEYNAGVAGTIADIVSNSLYLVVVGSEVAGNTDGALNGYVRIRYTDM